MNNLFHHLRFVADLTIYVNPDINTRGTRFDSNYSLDSIFRHKLEMHKIKVYPLLQEHYIIQQFLNLRCYNILMVFSLVTFSMILSFLKNSSMVDRTVLYNDRTVLFKVWRVTRLIFEKISWQKCPFFDRSVLYMSEVSFFLFEKQNCPFHLFFWPEVSFSLKKSKYFGNK